MHIPTKSSVVTTDNCSSPWKCSNMMFGHFLKNLSRLSNYFLFKTLQKSISINFKKITNSSGVETLKKVNSNYELVS